jgi:lipopolysaccharide assembly outer membrane protein LptD (OstA)
MLKYWIIILFFLIYNAYAEPILLKNADELIGQQTEIANQRTLMGNVILQQKNVVVKSNQAIQYINENKFLLNGNVVITQDSLILKSETILYDGNTYIAISNKQVELSDGKKFLIGDRGKYSTQTMIANFYDNVKLEDDSLVVYADNLIYDRKTAESFAEGNVIIKSKYQNVFAQADSVFNYSINNSTFAKSNSVLFQIDTNNDLTIDTLTIKSDSILANRNEDIYYFYDNVEIVRNSLKAVAQQGIYYKENEKIILYNPNLELKTHSILWLDSTQLHADSIEISLKDNKLHKINSYRNCIHISHNDTLNPVRIDQLSGNEIIIYIENDSLNKIESIENAKSVFFSTSNNEPDGVIEATAEKITIYIKDNNADEVIYVKSIPGKYHPEPFVNGKEKEFYLPDFIKEDNKPVKPKINKKLILKM